MLLNVLIVDDHPIVRHGLRTMLESYDDVEVIGEAGDGLEAVRLAEQLLPGIVVMDINMPTMNGIEATRQITARHPNIIVIGLSVNTADYHRYAMTRAGAAMLLAKEEAVEKLHDAIIATIKQRHRFD